MPTFDQMLTSQYTPKQWLQYYKNIWTRNLMARCIDMQSDITEKASNPDRMVLPDDGSGITLPIKERLELRKISVSEATQLLSALEILITKTDEEVVAFFSADNLKVAEDMKKAPTPTPKAGDACTQEDGTAGVWQDDGKGNLVCALPPVAEDAGAAKVPDAEAKV